MSLAEVADALRHDDIHSLREVLHELDDDLARQQVQISERRQTLADLLDRDENLAVSADVAGLLREMSRVVPTLSSDELAREGELLEMVEATATSEDFARMADQYRDVLGNPDAVERARLAGARFELLAELDPADPEVKLVATELAELGGKHFGDPTVHSNADWSDGWFAFLATLPPAQRKCMELVEELSSK